MSIITWLKDKFGSEIPLSGEDLAMYAEEYALFAGETYIRELAFYSAVNLIAGAISKCEFKTFEGGEEVKRREYYLWNIEPNINQSGSEFVYRWISQLYRTGEALIVADGGNLLVADKYDIKEYTLRGNLYANVAVGDITFLRTFAEEDVLFFKLTDQNMKKVVDGLYNSYSKLISYSMGAFRKSRGTKVKFRYEALPVAGSREREAFDSLVNEKIGKWLTSDNAALPLGKGQDIEELTQKTYSSESTRDIRAQIDDISDFTAKAFGIPPALLRGDVQGTKDALENFLTFCIRPLVVMLEKEINRKRNGYGGFVNETYLTIDTRNIKHFDVLDMAAGVEKLISSGVYSINDIREMIGERRLEGELYDEHFITKNFGALADELVKGVD